MKYFKLSVLLVCLVTLAGCLDNSTGNDKPIVEPAGSAEYYINNQSDIDLNVLYRRLGSQTDSLITILKDSTTNVFRDGAFGLNPSPSRSFGKIVFYKGSPDTSAPVFTIKPVKNEGWEITEEKGFEDSEYGFRKYELTVTKDGL